MTEEGEEGHLRRRKSKTTNKYMIRYNWEKKNKLKYIARYSLVHIRIW